MKIRIKIAGKVHNVGYRVFLTNLALELGIDRFSAFNSLAEGRETVIALLDADESLIDDFRERIKEQRPEKAVVDSIVCENYTNDVPPIERAMQAFQMEQWGKAIPIMVSMLGKQDVMIEKQDKMLGKQDETLQEIKGAREDLRTYMNRRFDRIEDELSRIKKVLKNVGIMK